MDFHALDLITWLVICILLHIFAPEEHKEEMGILVYVFVVFIFTAIWVILFVFCGYNVADLFNSISINIKW
ncbi:hypothetical protein M0Q50_07910 [bacterium]|jgi:hypothetical protein|nr:hypothetical protein [bacterium]